MRRCCAKTARSLDAAVSSAHHLGDLFGQRLDSEGLGDHAHACTEEAGTNGGVLGISCHEQDRQIGTVFAHDLSELPTVHSRQPDIRNEQIDPLVGPNDRQRLVAGRGLKRMIAQFLEYLTYQQSYRCVVLDQQDGLTRTLLSDARLAGRLDQRVGKERPAGRV